MGWVNRIPPPHTKCSPPSIEAAATGSVWECDECKTRWRITDQVMRFHEVRLGWSQREPWTEIHKEWVKLDG